MKTLLAYLALASAAFAETASVPTGKTVVITVVAGGGSPTTTWQWAKDGIDIKGQNHDTLTLVNVVPANSGDYRCLCTNAYGSTLSDSAALTVTGVPPLNPVTSITTK